MSDPGATVVTEWRITGRPSADDDPFEFIWSHLINPFLGDPERSARDFRSVVEGQWTDGPHLSRRTVEIGEWTGA